jgi:hypothetical protein
MISRIPLAEQPVLRTNSGVTAILATPYKRRAVATCPDFRLTNEANFGRAIKTPFLYDLRDFFNVLNCKFRSRFDNVFGKYRVGI